MAVASLVLGFLSFVCMIVGFFTSMIPFVGALFSFGGPVLGIAGIVTGGIAMSRSRQETGEPDGIAIGGLIVSVIGFLLSLIVALTCGLCNACVSTSSVANSSVNGSSGANPGANPFGAMPSLGGLVDQVGDRLELTVLLSQVQTSCSADPSGAGATAFMLPAAAPTMQGSICAEMGPNTAAPFGSACGGTNPNCTTNVSADSGPDAAAVRALGVEPATCTTYAVPDGTTRLTVCPDATGAKRLAVATNLGMVR